MMLYCGYRDWALDVFIKLKEAQFKVELATTPEELADLTKTRNYEAIILVGWSWKVPSEICNNFTVVGMHPSDLPKYAGGSPIQNQILDGLTSTNATLFRLNEKFDAGEIIDKEPISLQGHLKDVFVSISNATFELIKRFYELYPAIIYSPQEGTRHVVRRLKPEQSKITSVIVENQRLTARQLWDFIRCREDPYPNAYYEDETGKICFKVVEFSSNDE